MPQSWLAQTGCHGAFPLPQVGQVQPTADGAGVQPWNGAHMLGVEHSIIVFRQITISPGV